MGYCYDNRGRLCCDFCGQGGGARKVRCPFGYCPSAAACPDCRKTHKARLSKDAHRGYGCEQGHLECVAREERRRLLLEAGKSLRCSALGIKAGVRDLVHVLFADKVGRTVGFFMSPKTYAAIPLLTDATPEDYQFFGEIEAAPAEFHFGGTTKQVG